MRLTTGQQQQISEIISLWVADADPVIAEPLLLLYESQLEQTTVAWANSTDPDTVGTYLRIDGPQLWIEWLNVPGVGENVPHYHSVYRDTALDDDATA